MHAQNQTYWLRGIAAILLLYVSMASVSAQGQPSPKQLFSESLELAKQGKTLEAIAKLEQAHAMEPRNPNIVANLANHAGQAGLDDKAAAYYKKLWQLEPANASAKVGYAHFQSLALASQRKFAEAVELLETVESESPGHSKILWNLALMSAEAEQHEKALKYWVKLSAVEPQNMHVQSKIIQAYQALDRIADRDQAIAKILAMHKDNVDPEFIKRNTFCREQYSVGDWKVFVFQFFDPGSKNKLFYRYTVTDTKGEERFRLSLGSYQTTTDILRELGEIPADGRIYHLDYYENSKHSTYGMFNKQPSYDELRDKVKTIIKDLIAKQ